MATTDTAHLTELEPHDDGAGRHEDGGEGGENLGPNAIVLDDRANLYAGTQRAEEIHGRAGDDTITGGAGADTLFGGFDNDRLSGDQGGDTLQGGRGDDTVEGGAGDDHILGNGGADLLRGGFGDDNLVGGGGDDTLIGGRGDDVLEGGAGADRFVFERGSGQDVIVAFDPTHGDVIELLGTGVSSFAELAPHISDGAEGAIVSLGGVTITVLGIHANELNFSGFMFI